MKILLQIVQMLPAIIAAVKEAEALVPLSGAGKAKLDFILGLVSDTVDGASELAGPVAKVVSRIVALCNATGAFGKGGAA